MPLRQGVSQESVELFKCGVERRFTCLVVEALKRPGRGWQSAWRLADTQVHPPRGEIFQDSENLRDFEGAVVLQHHPAGADANPARRGQEIGYENLRRDAREQGAAVVFRHPKSLVSEVFSPAGQRNRVCDGFGRRRARGNGAFVQDGERVGHLASLNTKSIYLIDFTLCYVKGVVQPATPLVRGRLSDTGLGSGVRSRSTYAGCDDVVVGRLRDRSDRTFQ